MRKSRWSDYAEPETDPTQALIDAPEPDPWTRLEPLFPMGGLPFTPTSKCPHQCPACKGEGKRRRCGFCEGTGKLYVVSTGEFFADCPDCEGTGRGDALVDCPDCEGTGRGAIPKGSSLVCMICHKSGKDGHPALPLGVKPLPLDPPEEAAEAAEGASEDSDE